MTFTVSPDLNPDHNPDLNPIGRFLSDMLDSALHLYHLNTD